MLSQTSTTNQNLPCFRHLSPPGLCREDIRNSECSSRDQGWSHSGPHFVLGLTVSDVFPVRCLISKMSSTAPPPQSHKPGILNPKQRSQKQGAGTQQISLLILLQLLTFTMGFSLCPPSFNSSNREKNEKNDFFFKWS